MPRIFSCCFTGYRPEKYGFDIDGTNEQGIELQVKMEIYVRELVKKGVTVFYCGCARGFDIFAAETVALIKEEKPQVKLVSVMPFKNMQASWEDKWKTRLENILKASDEVVVLSEDYHRGAYSNRNKYMVDRSNYVITYFDGQKGGTENTLKYAQKKNKTIINLAENEPLHPTVPDLYPVYEIEELPFCKGFNQK